MHAHPDGSHRGYSRLAKVVNEGGFLQHGPVGTGVMLLLLVVLFVGPSAALALRALASRNGYRFHCISEWSAVLAPVPGGKHG